MPTEYKQDYKKTRAYAPKIYNDPNMSDALRDIYRTLESRYVHEGRTIDPSFYNVLSIFIYSDAWGLDKLKKTLEQIKPYNSRLLAIDDIRNLIHRRTIHEKENVYSAIGNRDHTKAVIALMLYCLETEQPFNLAYFIIRRMYFFRDRKGKVLPSGMILTRLFRNLKENMAEHPFDERYKLIPKKMSSLKEKQPKKPPPKRTRNVGKSKRTQLSTSSLTESPPSDNRDLPSTKLSLRSYNIHSVIIMAQQQHAADVHPDELCPPNKRYDLMDANKKVDLDHVQCPPESKILTNIIKNHPL
ncbi:hypothetical protein Tco_0728674 [Tanacetum coccineum]|uniref:Uncharacterized protein n=1 Tax=Tanacetum coccineum TaxID=301880 RepID=A0ABQ4YLX0_9ASTR